MLPPFPFMCFIDRKKDEESSHWFKAVFRGERHPRERDETRGGSLCRKWELSHLADAERRRMVSAFLPTRTHKKVSPPPVVSGLQLSWHRSAARLSEFQTQIFIWRGLTEAIHLSPARSLNMTEGRRRREHDERGAWPRSWEKYIGLVMGDTVAL